MLTKGHERLDDKANAKLLSLLEAGDPRGEVRLAWHAKETLRGLYDIADPGDADAYLTDLVEALLDENHPVEVRSLGRTLRRWHTHLVAWHRGKVSNGPTEAANNLIKRIKRIGFGFRKFTTTGFASCSTPDAPTGSNSPPIQPTEVRRASFPEREPVPPAVTFAAARQVDGA